MTADPCFAPDCLNLAAPDTFGLCATHAHEESRAAFCVDFDREQERYELYGPPPVVRPVLPERPETWSVRADAYGQVAVQNIMARLWDEDESRGTNNALHAAAYALGRLVGGDVISKAEAERLITEAGEHLGHARRRVDAIVRHSIDKGAAVPLVLTEGKMVDRLPRLSSPVGLRTRRLRGAIA